MQKNKTSRYVQQLGKHNYILLSLERPATVWAEWSVACSSDGMGGWVGGWVVNWSEGEVEGRAFAFHWCVYEQNDEDTARLTKLKWENTTN